jgi:hypothetical protein
VTARFVNLDTGTVSETSDAEFFASLFGHAPKTKAEREAEYRAKCERYADLIEQSGDWGIPPPCLADARAIVAERRVQAQVERDLRFTIEQHRTRRASQGAA